MTILLEGENKNMKIQIVIEADFNEEELAKLKDEKTGLIPSKGEYAGGITVGHDNGIGMIHVYNQKEYGMKNFNGIGADILSNVHIKETKIVK